MAGALLKYNGSSLQTPSGAMGINNLVPENVKSGVNIGGVVGSFSGNPILTASSSGRVYSYSQTFTFSNIPKKPIMFGVYVMETITDTGGITSVIIDLSNDGYCTITARGRYTTSAGTWTYNETAQTLTITSPSSSYRFFFNGIHYALTMVYQ